jgi:energy-coupling factor transport system permease protein
VIVILYGAIGGLYPWHYRNVIYLLIPFAIAITLIQILVARGVQPLPAVDFLGLQIPIRGLTLGSVISFRAMVLGISFALFMMAAHPYDITQAAVKMGVQFRYAYMIGFALRFLPLFTEDFVKIRQAQASRGLDENRLGPFTRWVSMPVLLFPLIMSSLRHAQTLAIALEMCGLSTASTYGRTYMKEVSMRMPDWLFLAVFSAGAIIVIYLRIIGVIG